MIEILILEGGFNEEHKVSLTTAKEVKKVLKNNNIHYRSLIVHPQTFENVIDKYSNQLICFNALHGTFGEDGKIQKILKKKKFKFTHSGIYSSKNCFNKIYSKNLLTNFKIRTPDYFKIKPHFLNENYLKKYKKKFDKFIIKPNESGSSLALTLTKDVYMFMFISLSCLHFTHLSLHCHIFSWLDFKRNVCLLLLLLVTFTVTITLNVPT